MIYKYVSIYNVVEKLYRDYSHKMELDILDVVEWAAEALDLIGAYAQLKRIPNETITIANYKAKLPCELVTLDGVKYNGVPLVYSVGVYGPENKVQGTEVTNTLNRTTVDDQNFPMLGNKTRSAALPYSYIVQDGYIHTNLQSGEMVLSYTGIEVDSNGFPLVPDDAAYTSAITAYVQMMLDRKEWRAQRAPEAFYRDSERAWRKFSTSARARGIMPSVDKMETMRRMWTRILPNVKMHNSGFSSGIAPNARNQA